MNSKIIFRSISIVIILFSSCGILDHSSSSLDDFFFLKNNGAEMPVHVRGNEQSNNFIIFLVGGPGAPSYAYSEGIPEFKNTLEKNCVMVYWDQRACGNSQGHVNPSTMTISHFVEDLYKLICVVNYRYNGPNIFLMGHSWGGMLGCAYLIDQKHQSLVKGFIYTDGLHNTPLAYKLEREYVLQYAPVLISRNIKVDKMKAAIEWCNTNLTIETKDQESHIQELAGEIEESLEEVSDEVMRGGLDYFFGSENNPILSMLNLLAAGELMWDEIRKTNFSSDLGKISLPVLIIWGKYDGITPIGLAYDAYDNLGTSEDMKKIVICEYSNHMSMAQEPIKFVSEVTTFIQQFDNYD